MIDYFKISAFFAVSSPYFSTRDSYENPFLASLVALINWNLEDTVKSALDQIKEKKYVAGIIAQGIPKERIYKQGFGFDKKEALVISGGYNEL